MTPNQSHVAGLELALSKVDPWSDRAVWLRDLIDQAKSAPAEPVSREVVEVVAHAVDHPDAGYKVYKDFAIWMADGEWTHNSLMTVAQHNRIVAAPTAPPEPDAELVELLRDTAAWFADRDIECNLARDIDAKLASLKGVDE